MWIDLKHQELGSGEGHLLEIEQNNLVHIGEMDSETGRLLLTYRETPDVELRS